MVWASVPETPIDEHGDTFPRKDDIGRASQTRYWAHMYAVSEPSLMQEFADLDLGFRVP